MFRFNLPCLNGKCATRTRTQRKTKQGASMKSFIKTISTLVATGTIAVQACWIDDFTRVCGACPGTCNYLVVCGLNKSGVAICSGKSGGKLVRAVKSASTGAYSYMSRATVCGAPVTLVPACCGGARTTTEDWSPLNEEWAVFYGCKRT